MAKNDFSDAEEKLETLYDIMDELKLIEPSWSAAKQEIYDAQQVLSKGHKQSALALLEDAKKDVSKARVDELLKKRITEDIKGIQRSLR